MAKRAHGVHADNCPVYRTIRGCVGTTTSLVIKDLPDGA